MPEETTDDSVVAEERPQLQTLQRGLRVLETISASAGGELSARDLAEQLALSLRTCYSLLERLRQDGYVVRFVGGRYGLGPKLEELQRSLADHLAPDSRILGTFTLLQKQVGQMVSVNGWYGSEIVVQRAFPDRAVSVPIGAGYRSRSTSRCSNKAILAFVNEQRLLRHFASEARPAWTERTITDFQLFRESLLEVAERGYALDLGETLREAYGVAAPFFTAWGFPLGSFGVAAEPSAFDREQETLIEAVRAAGEEASRLLGYTGPYPPASPLRRRRKTATS